MDWLATQIDEGCWMSCDLNTEALGGCVVNCAIHDMKHRYLFVVSNLLCHLCACQLWQMVTQPRQWSRWWRVVIVQPFYSTDLLLLRLPSLSWIKEIGQIWVKWTCMWEKKWAHFQRQTTTNGKSPVIFPANPSLRNHWKHPWNSQVVGGSEIGSLLAPKDVPRSGWIFLVLGITPNNYPVMLGIIYNKPILIKDPVIIWKLDFL